MNKNYYVYILSNEAGKLYVGVTNDLSRRIYEHKMGVVKGFTQMHGIHRLIYYEETDDVGVAIEREKQIKRWRRKKKLTLVRTMNPMFENLSEGWYEEEQGEK